MCDDGDLEQECEDAVFELCDVRERFPSKCADELGQCLRLTSRIYMKPVRSNATETLDNTLLSEKQRILLEQVDPVKDEEFKNWKKLDHRLKKMVTEIDNLTTILEQIKNTEMSH